MSISLLNSSYKNITKILTNCLNPFLDNLMEPNQFTSISGRSITNTYLDTYEIIHYNNTLKK